MQEMRGNVYFECRKRAAEWNDRLRSRESAAECMGISESSLAHYELGITKSVPVDIVVMMSELYSAPELRNRYCKEECPIGAGLPLATEGGTVSDVTVALLDSLDKADIRGQVRKLLKVAADGKVSESERDDIMSAVDALEAVSVATSALRLAAERGKGEG